MKKFISATIAIALILMSAGAAFAQQPDPAGSPIEETGKSRPQCTKINSGLLTDSQGRPLTMGFDEFGYNYQAHKFIGTYDSADRVWDGLYFGKAVDFINHRLTMKWTDKWLSNIDCDGDGQLDRGLLKRVAGATPDGISKGWLTNQAKGEYLDASGVTRRYTYHVKIVWAGTGGTFPDDYRVTKEVYKDKGDGDFRTLTAPES